MVVLDTIPNGYRDIILPMALEDEVLRRAIGVVAAQHLGRENRTSRMLPKQVAWPAIIRFRMQCDTAIGYTKLIKTYILYPCGCARRPRTRLGVFRGRSRVK